MFNGGLLLASLLLSTQFHLSAQFQVAGEIVCPPGTGFREAQIESTDHKIVKRTGISKKNKFSFSVPEGLYKITITTESGQSEQRTIEVRQAFANEDYEIPVKIEMLDVRASAKTVKRSPAAEGPDNLDSPSN